MDKKIIEYIIPIQDKEHVDLHNKMCKEMFGLYFTPFVDTDRHIDILIDKLCEAIEELGEQHGWYIGDDIKVKIELEYEPENK